MSTETWRSPLPLWGGIECSLNRVGDKRFDQLDFSKHYKNGREHLERIASLGIETLRYPVLWERHHGQRASWSFTTARLRELFTWGIQPVVGLMHHGYGPPFTGLSDPGFPEQFAAYALSVASRFPEIKTYALINEPLTTARFSGLYALWYPHQRDDRLFAIMFLNQMKAIILATRAIREFNPEARFLQTEDFSKTFSTPFLRYQADFENERRWLTFDVLCGKFDRDHALWDFFCALDIPRSLLDFFLEYNAPPDLIGANYYLTSERFLDENLSDYPVANHGGNGMHAYADVEAIRVDHPFRYGLEVLMAECWDRFGIPMVIGEAHFNGAPDLQIAWLSEIYQNAQRMNENGVPVKAVTVWAMLGVFGWDKLLTDLPGHYEPGPFDISDNRITETAYAEFIRNMVMAPGSQTGSRAMPWWRTGDRLLYFPRLSAVEEQSL